MIVASNILIVAAHSDDEALGCGGTIARHIAEGDTVNAVFMADGVTARSDNTPDKLEKRILAAREAQNILGIANAEHLQLPDNRLDSVPLLDIVQKLEAIIFKIAPTLIYTHHYGDLNIDHSITHQAVMTAVRPMPENTVKEVYAFEALSSTEWQTPSKHPFLPDTYIDISKYLKNKMQAIAAYDLEMHPAPHSRSTKHVEHLAYHRGLSIGVEAAEAFMTIRRII